MKTILNTVFAVALLVTGAAVAEEAVTPLTRGHSHNDYYRTQPLLDALERGIWSVEADIFLIDGELRVAHDRDKAKPGVTLEKLYLDPLLTRVRAGKGPTNDGPELTLLIDIKDDGETTYGHLREVLKHYGEMLTSYGAEGVTPRAVKVVISGSRPIAMMAAETERLAFLDGRIADVGVGDPALYPMVSMSWTSEFDWKGRDAIAPEEQAKLDELVAKAHARGQRIRFWGLPLRPAVWPVLYAAGVDYINADNLDRLRAFLLDQEGAAGASR